MSSLQWTAVVVGSALFGALGTLWVLGRRAVGRWQRERKAQSHPPPVPQKTPPPEF